MLGKLLPLILVLLGIAGGMGAGLYLRPDPPAPDESAEIPAAQPPAGEAMSSFEFANQFMVPLVRDGRISGTMVLKLALDLPESQHPLIEGNAARLRDAMLQVLFDHANSGGFEGAFTDHGQLGTLRRALLEAAVQITGPGTVHRVLITDILRTGS